MSIYTSTIIDCNHNDELNIPLVAQNGVTAIIHKASQGLTFKDDKYIERKQQAHDAGLLWGAYHFGNCKDAVTQANTFLQFAAPTDNDVIVLDWEPVDGDPSPNDMTYNGACDFVEEVHRLTGRYPMLYGSNFLFEKIPTHGDSVLAKCPLWLAAYNSNPTIPYSWKNYTLWQFTGDGTPASAKPRTFVGCNNKPDYFDVSRYNGTVEELRAAWPFSTP